VALTIEAKSPLIKVFGMLVPRPSTEDGASPLTRLSLTFEVIPTI
jgi:hypothetical protein